MVLPYHNSTRFIKWSSRQKIFAGIRDRILIIVLVRRKMTAAEIAEKLDRCIRWVQDWVSRYREQGFKGLFDQPRCGQPPHLPPDREQAFIDRILEGPKSSDQVSIFHWGDIQRILLEEFGASYSQSGVYALLDRLGLSWVTTRPIHEFNDPQKMEAWKVKFKADVEKIKKKKKCKELQIWFQDEARIGQKGNIYRIWTRKGVRTRTVKQMGFKSAYILGAINPKTGERIGLVFEDLDSSVVNVHLKLISKAVPSHVHVVLVLDQAGFHKSEELRVPKNITLYHQEAYSPELNPVERVWLWLKTTFLGNKIFKKIDDIFTAGVEAWLQLTTSRVTSMCRVKWLPCTN